LRQAEAIHHRAEGLGPLDRVEVLALDVLDDGPFVDLLIGSLADERGDVIEPGLGGGLQAPLPGDEDERLVGRLGPIGRDQNRLKHPLPPDRVGQFLELLGVELFSRLIWIRRDLSDRNRSRLLRADGRSIGGHIRSVFLRRGVDDQTG